MTNSSLNKAKCAKQDEYYTRLYDIEDEMKHYKQHFKDKVVYCNCDDPLESNFAKYFMLNFNALGLKRLICTCYGTSPVAGRQLSLFEDFGKPLSTKELDERKAYYMDINRDDPKGLCNIEDYEKLLKQPGIVKRLKGNGDFRSDECIALLEQADIVVTNPPFSLFRDYVAQLMKYGKKFIILGNPNAVTYKEVFPIFKENKIWIGFKPMSTDMLFHVTDEFADELKRTKKEGSGYRVVDDELLGRVSAVWFTNLDIKKRHEILDLFERYEQSKYPKYDDYDAIDVSKISMIPCDYDGVMGVPISFMDRYNPEQFELIGLANHGSDNEYDLFKPKVNGKELFKRLLIRRKKQ